MAVRLLDLDIPVGGPVTGKAFPACEASVVLANPDPTGRTPLVAIGSSVTSHPAGRTPPVADGTAAAFVRIGSVRCGFATPRGGAPRPRRAGLWTSSPSSGPGRRWTSPGSMRRRSSGGSIPWSAARSKRRWGSPTGPVP
ncbi:MAG TPA: hypothetical protein VH682_31900 [Gemmataceae bacterium]